MMTAGLEAVGGIHDDCRIGSRRRNLQKGIDLAGKFDILVHA